MKKTCATCRKSGYRSNYCESSKWLICKHSDRGNDKEIIKQEPYHNGKLSREVSYWEGQKDSINIDYMTAELWKEFILLRDKKEIAFKENWIPVTRKSLSSALKKFFK